MKNTPKDVDQALEWHQLKASEMAGLMQTLMRDLYGESMVEEADQVGRLVYLAMEVGRLKCLADEEALPA